MIWIAVGLTVAILAVYFMGKFFGWFKPQLKLVEGEGIVDRLPSGAVDESRYRIIAQTVKNSLEGTNYQSAYFIGVADQLLVLNNNELRVVANIYSRDLSTKDYPTLRQLIQGEFLGSHWGLFGAVPTPCNSTETAEINSPCHKQKMVINKLNEINA